MPPRINEGTADLGPNFSSLSSIYPKTDASLQALGQFLQSMVSPRNLAAMGAAGATSAAFPPAAALVGTAQLAKWLPALRVLAQVNPAVLSGMLSGAVGGAVGTGEIDPLSIGLGGAVGAFGSPTAGGIPAGIRGPITGRSGALGDSVLARISRQSADEDPMVAMARAYRATQEQRARAEALQAARMNQLTSGQRVAPPVDPAFANADPSVAKYIAAQTDPRVKRLDQIASTLAKSEVKLGNIGEDIYDQFRKLLGDAIPPEPVYRSPFGDPPLPPASPQPVLSRMIRTQPWQDSLRSRPPAFYTRSNADRAIQITNSEGSFGHTGLVAERPYTSEITPLWHLRDKIYKALNMVAQPNSPLTQEQKQMVHEHINRLRQAAKEFYPDEYVP